MREGRRIVGMMLVIRSHNVYIYAEQRTKEEEKGEDQYPSKTHSGDTILNKVEKVIKSMNSCEQQRIENPFVEGDED